MGHIVWVTLFVIFVFLSIVFNCDKGVKGEGLSSGSSTVMLMAVPLAKT